MGASWPIGGDPAECDPYRSAHDHDAVLSDFPGWRPILRPGDVMIMDDHDLAGVMWPTTLPAVDTPFAVTAHEGFECLPYKCRVRKPVG